MWLMEPQTVSLEIHLKTLKRSVIVPASLASNWCPLACGTSVLKTVLWYWAVCGRLYGHGWKCEPDVRYKVSWLRMVGFVGSDWLMAK
jgi:hypothetical protein